MELTFEERRQKNIRTQKYMASIEVAVYVVAIIILFIFGGYFSDLTITEVSLISIDGIIKVAAIIFTYILLGIVLFPGPLLVLRDIDFYFYLKD